MLAHEESLIELQNRSNRCREHNFFSQKHPCCSLIPPGVSWACQHWHCTFSTLHTQCFDVAAPAEAGEHKFARPHALPTLPAHVMPTFSAMLGVLAATLLLLVFVWGAAGWCSDVTQALSVGVPFVGGHAHNSEQSCRLEGALEQGDYCSSPARHQLARRGSHAACIARPGQTGRRSPSSAVQHALQRRTHAGAGLHGCLCCSS